MKEGMVLKTAVNVCKAKHQVVKHGAEWYKIEYEAIKIDRLREWDKSNHRFIAREEGEYFTYLNFAYRGVGEGRPLWARIMLNDEPIAQNYGHQFGGGCPWGKCGGLVHLRKGDYIEAWTRNTSSKEQTMHGDSCHNNLTIFRI